MLKNKKLFDLTQLEDRCEDALRVYDEFGRFVRGKVDGKDWDAWHEDALEAIIEDDAEKFEKAERNMGLLCELELLKCKESETGDSPEKVETEDGSVESGEVSGSGERG